MMITLLFLVFLKICFLAVLLAMKVKTFTLHLCLAGRIYWRFERQSVKVTKHDTAHTLHAGPVVLQVVR